MDQFQRTPVWSCSLKDVSQETGGKDLRFSASRFIAPVAMWGCPRTTLPRFNKRYTWAAWRMQISQLPVIEIDVLPSCSGWSTPRCHRVLRSTAYLIDLIALGFDHNDVSLGSAMEQTPPKLLDISGYLLLSSSTCFSWNSKSKEQEANMARGGPKKKSLDGRGSCSVRQTCTRSCLQNDVKYAWCRRWESKEKERTRETHTERKRDRDRDRERKREREGEIETDSADRTRVDLRCVGVKSRCEKYVIMRKLHCKRFVGRTLRPALGKYRTTQVSVTRILVQQQGKSEIMK